MANVLIWSSLRSHTGGQANLRIEAKTVREMLDKLGDAHPGLKPQLQRGVSVSIDGVIYRDGWLETLKPDSEVVLLPRMVGG
jgi:molybdopterin converting factor small subunit